MLFGSSSARIAGPPADLWQLYFPSPTVELEAAQPAKDDAYPNRITVYERLRRWVATSATFARVRPEDILAQDFALDAKFAHLQRGEDAPFRRSEPLTGSYPCQEVLDALALAVHVQLLETCTPPPDPKHLRARLRSRRLYIRVYDMAPLTPIRSLKADKIGRLVSVRGSVIRVAPLRPFVTTMSFICPRCQVACTFPLTDGRYEQPPGCPSTGCRAKLLVPDRRNCTTRDWQKIKIQEAPSSGNEYDSEGNGYGRVPRQMEIELSETLIDCCVPGDILDVVGIVKSMETVTDGGGARYGASSSKPRCMFHLYIDAVSVRNTRTSQRILAQMLGSTTGSQAGILAQGPSPPGTLPPTVNGDADLNLSVLDLHAIRDIASSKHLFELLVGSVCPSIFGHEVVKAGLLLGMVGGRPRSAGTAEHASVGKRSDIHVLVVGDPGMGKSQMLTAVAALAPRGVYVCGNTTSSSGLTVTVVKDAVTSDFALEAGALVMGDQGCCCIDEFDKMSTGEHQALLEAMEQQSISVAKAGIVCSLSARTAILAAANPVGGHYNQAKTVAENLKLPPNLLSRFDLLFVLLDRCGGVLGPGRVGAHAIELTGLRDKNPPRPNEQMDRLLSTHVMALHGGKQQSSSGVNLLMDSTLPESWRQSGAYAHWREEQPLSLRLRSHVSTDDPVPAHLLRKYIAYARHYAHPKLGREAADKLRDFYLRLRQNSATAEASVPITSRQLESLVRLAEARARLELREKVTEQDALDAIEVFKETVFYDTLADAMGATGASPGGFGNGALGRFGFGQGACRSGKMSAAKTINAFVSLLEREASRRADAFFSTSQLKQVFEQSGLPLPQGFAFADFLDRMNSQNHILKKGPQQWKLQISSFASQRS